MMSSHPSDEKTPYRVALVSTDPYGIHVEAGARSLSLPRLSIPSRTRTAAELQRAAHRYWGTPIFILDFLKASDSLPCCAVAQLFPPSGLRGLTAVEMDNVPLSELTHAERAIIDDICSGNKNDRRPFSRLGWIKEAILWAQDHLKFQAEPTEISQLNASSSFSLVRFTTANRFSYWLKATGKPNRHEFSITAALAKICPQYLPSIIAKRSDWNAWLMEDAGKSLEHHTERRCLKLAIGAMAELQRATVDHAEYLLAAGAVDQRISLLQSSIPAMVAYLEQAMEIQTSTRVPRLGTGRLRALGRLLEDAFAAMANLDIPDTILHGDMNRGNILIRSGNCVFTDWCEARIGNPFLTFQHMRLLLKGPEACEQAEQELKAVYRQRWSDSLSAKQVDQAFLLAPLLAIASYLYGRGDWLGSSPKSDPSFAGYARSLARLLDREARTPQVLEALCH